MTWQTPLTFFVLFNLIGAPLIGRLVWLGMVNLDAGSMRLAAVLLSVLGATAILAVNVVLTRRSIAAGLPDPGGSILWIVTGLTFILTIGTGFFSPLTLIWYALA